MQGVPLLIQYASKITSTLEMKGIGGFRDSIRAIKEVKSEIVLSLARQIRQFHTLCDSTFRVQSSGLAGVGARCLVPDLPLLNEDRASATHQPYSLLPGQQHLSGRDEGQFLLRAQVHHAALPLKLYRSLGGNQAQLTVLGKHSYAIACQSDDMPFSTHANVAVSIQSDIVCGRQLQMLSTGKGHPSGAEK